MADWKQAPIVDDVQEWQSAPVVEDPEQPKTKSEEAFRRFGHPRGAAGEAILSTIGNIGTAAVAGIGGLAEINIERAKTAFPGTRDPDFTGAAAGRVKKIQQAGAELFAPRSATGQAAAEDIAGGVEAVGTAVKYPLSAVPFALGGSEERQEFMEVPMGNYLGEVAEDFGASPLWATVAHMVPDLAMTAAGLGTAGKIKAAGKAPKVKPPTIDELKAQSTVFYKAVDDSGMTIADNSLKTAHNNIVKAAESQGLRKKLTPKTHAALEDIATDVRAGSLTLSKAEELRRVIKQAQAATDTADAAMATRVLRKWDDFIENLKPRDITGGGPEAIQYLKSARNLWSRSRKTEIVEELIDRAGTRAGQFTGSGFENALRTEFRQLALNRKNIKMFTKKEQAAIKNVASGHPLDNAFRTIGKLAPTGVVSLGIGSGIGFAAGGPTGAVALPLVGSISRKLAEAHTLKRAKQASEVMRRGPT